MDLGFVKYEKAWIQEDFDYEEGDLNDQKYHQGRWILDIAGFVKHEEADLNDQKYHQARDLASRKWTPTGEKIINLVKLIGTKNITKQGIWCRESGC